MSECKKSVKVKYSSTRNNASAGSLQADGEVIRGGDGWIYLCVPSNNDRGFEDCGALQVYRNKKPDTNYPCWHISGDVTKPDTLTLTPSIHLKGTWHGYLRNGRLESC